MRELMSRSLEEAQKRKEEEAPLLSKGEDEVVRLFGDGPTFSALLGAGLSPAALLAQGSPLRPALLVWLQLEQKCTKRWWACRWGRVDVGVCVLLGLPGGRVPAGSSCPQQVLPGG